MYKILGISEERTECDCCGKNNLKRTVVIQTLDGKVHFFGTTCASKMIDVSAVELTKSASLASQMRAQQKEDFIRNHPLSKRQFKEYQELRSSKYDITPSEWREMTKDIRLLWSEMEI